MSRTGAENLLEPGAGAPTRSMLQYPSQYMHGQASAYNSNNTINTIGTTASSSKSSSDSAGSRRSAEVHTVTITYRYIYMHIYLYAGMSRCICY
jgi:hypothetical protein